MLGGGWQEEPVPPEPCKDVCCWNTFLFLKGGIDETPY